MRFLEPEEIAALAEVITPRYRALVILDTYCGLRLSELAGLRRRQIDLAAGAVRVAENAVEVRSEVVWGAPKTRAGRRTMPMPSGVRTALEEHLVAYVDANPDAVVFAGAGGGVLRAGQWRARHGTAPCEPPDSNRYGPTTFATPPSHSGSPLVRTPGRSPPGRAIRPCRSCSIATATCSTATRPSC